MKLNQSLNVSSIKDPLFSALMKQYDTVEANNSVKAYFSVYIILQGLVSVKRIETFLSLPELDNECVKNTSETGEVLINFLTVLFT